MNKINKEFSEDFKGLCKSLGANQRGTEAKSYKRKQNRNLVVTEKSDGGKLVCLYYHTSLVAFYDPESNKLVLKSCGYGTRTSTKALLNSLCPQGYCFFSREYEGYTRSPKEEERSDTLIIKPYI
jgi:hypothetical protein